MKYAAVVTAVLVVFLFALAALGAGAGSQPVVSLLPEALAVDELGAAMPDEVVQGALFMTDAMGTNFLRILMTDEVFVQALRETVSPGGAAEAVLDQPQNESAAGCWNALQNPGFEAAGSWDLPGTAFPAGYSQEQVYAGAWAMRTGITTGANTYSFSSASQLVELPGDVTAAKLTFRLYPQSSEPAALVIPESPAVVLSEGAESQSWGDAQWVFLYAENGAELARFVSMRSNARTWAETYAFDLLPYKGQKVRVYFASFNNGHSGVTSMFVDETAVELCSDAAPPTATATSTPSATATATSTPSATATSTPTNTPTATTTATPTSTPTATTTATPTNTPTVTPSATPLPPLVCTEGVLNNGFETVEAWRLPTTEYTAAYSQEQSRTGVWSMRTGITELNDQVYSFSSALQTVVIPAEATVAELSFFLFPQSSESTSLLIPATIFEALSAEAEAVGDAQWVIIYDEAGNELARPVTMRSDARAWEEHKVDLLPFAGRTVQVYFGTFNNGWDGITAMFVDDVYLELCTGYGPPEEEAYLPVVLGDAPVGLSGRVLDGLDLPLALVPMNLDGRVQTSTDGDGFYSFVNVSPGPHVVMPQIPGYACSPAEQAASVPPSVGELDFVCRPVSYP